MRYLFLFSTFFFLVSCDEKTGNQHQAPSASSKTEQHQLPPAAPKLPANLSVPDLRNEVRNVIRTQLPNSYPEMRNGQNVLKGFSFDIEAHTDGKPIWVISEKLYDAESRELLTGGKYLLLWANVDPGAIGYAFSQNDERIGLVLRAKPGQSFIFHPYAQELSDEVKTEVIIGWYDRVQDATLARGLVALQTLAGSMDKWNKDG